MSQSSRLPLLLVMVVMLMLWLAGDELRSRTVSHVEQLKNASLLARRSTDLSLPEMRAAAQEAARRRAVIQTKLSTRDSPQVTRARIGSELRALCFAAGTACGVRLSDTSSVSSSPSADRSGPAPQIAVGAASDLEKLGIFRSRAILTGTFKGDELDAIVRRLSEDGGAVWRLNAAVVRGDSFELEVERQLRPATSAAESR